MKKQRRQIAVGNPFQNEGEDDYNFETPSEDKLVKQVSHTDNSKTSQQQQKRFVREEVFGVAPVEQPSTTDFYSELIGVNLNKQDIQLEPSHFNTQQTVSEELVLDRKQIQTVESKNSSSLVQEQKQEIKQELKQEIPKQTVQMVQPVEDAITRSKRLLQQSQDLISQTKRGQHKPQLIQQTQPSVIKTEAQVQESVQTKQEPLKNTQEIKAYEEILPLQPDTIITKPAVQIQVQTVLVQPIEPVFISQEPKQQQQIRAPPHKPMNPQPPPPRVVLSKPTQLNENLITKEPYLGDIQIVQQPKLKIDSPQQQHVPSSQVQEINSQPQKMVQVTSQSPHQTQNRTDQEPDKRQDFEFQFIIKVLNKQQRDDHLKTLSKLWASISDETQGDYFLNILATIMKKCLGSNSQFLDSNFSEFRQEIITQLEKEFDQEFIQAFEDVFKQVEQNEHWETILLLNFAFEQEEIPIHNQEILIKYLKHRNYMRHEEVIVLLLVAIIKMEQGVLKTTQFNEIFLALRSDGHSDTMFYGQLLWLALKIYPLYANRKNIQQLMNEIMVHRNTKDQYFIYLLILNIICGGQQTQALVEYATTFNHLGFLESQAILFQTPVTGLFYYKLAQHCVEKQKQKVALEFLKHSLDLGFTQASELRDQLIQDIYQQNQQQQSSINTTGGTSTGLFGQFKQVVKNTIGSTQQQTKPPQKNDFYYDNDLKGWVINGELAKDDEGSSNHSQKEGEIPQPPPPATNLKPEQGISQLKGSQPIPILTQQRVQKPYTPPQQQQCKNLTVQQQQVQANPFVLQTQVLPCDANRQKKQNLLKNRYAQQ